jgi:hypothetical protein
VSLDRKLTTEVLTTAALGTLVAPTEFAGGCFVTKAGYVGCVLRLAPLPGECLDEEESDRYCSLFASASGVFSDEIRLYQYYLKIPNAEIPWKKRPSEVANACTIERIKHCTERKLLSVESYMVVLWEVPLAGDGDEALASYGKMLRDQVGIFCESIGFLKPEIMDEQGQFRFFRRLLNPSPIIAAAGAYDPDDYLEFQIAATSLRVGPVLQVGGYGCHVLTMRKAPKETKPAMLWRLQQIPAQMTVVVEWKRRSTGDTQSAISRVKTHQDITGRNWRNQERGDKREDVKRLTEAEAELSRDVGFGGLSLTVLLYVESPATASLALAEAYAALTKYGGDWSEDHDKLALIGWLATIPGNHRYSVRGLMMSEANLADISPIYTVASGDKFNPHLEDEYLAVVETRHQTPMFLNLHVGEVGNTLITGDSGCGKSFLTGFLVSHYQKYGPYTTIFDIGGGFRYVTERCGGAYCVVGMGSASARINVFSLPPTEDNVAFLSMFIRLLLEMDGPPLAASELAILEDQILAVYAIPEHRRRLGELSLPERLATRLSRWVGRGALAYLFDNEVDTLASADFQTFNFASADAPTMEALLVYVLHRASDRIGSNPLRPKMFVIDEAWKFMKHSATQAYIVEALKTWRKRNAVLVLAAQNVTDIPAAILPDVQICAETRIHGANPRIAASAWLNGLGLANAEVEAIKNLQKPGEFLLQGQGVFRLRVDDDSYSLYANSAKDNARRLKYA